MPATKIRTPFFFAVSSEDITVGNIPPHYSERKKKFPSLGGEHEELKYEILTGVSFAI
jgi:hypothetical protein